MSSITDEGILSNGSPSHTEHLYNGRTELEHYESLGFTGVPAPLEDRYDGELVDYSSSGKKRPWKSHKTNGMLLSESFERLNKMRKAEAVRYCGTSLKFARCPNGHESRLKWASFCRVRLCPMCAWRRSLKVANQVKLIAHAAAQQFRGKWLFLTLTCKNVNGSGLTEQLDILTVSFRRLFQRKVFRDNVLGFFRSLEVTRNAVDGTYHPHLHVLLFVKPSYFSGRNYIKTEEWSTLWADAMRVDYKPIVDIRVVKGKRNKAVEKKLLEERGIGSFDDGTFAEIEVEGQLEAEFLDEGAVAEISKYATKPADYIIKDDQELTDEVVAVYERNLNHRRLFAFGGVLKDIYEYLKKQDAVEDIESDRADLVRVDNDIERCTCSVCQSDLLEELYRWVPSAGNYLKPKI